MSQRQSSTGASSFSTTRIPRAAPLSAHGAHFLFFQAEDGIRDYKVTGVQTCALPISSIFLVIPEVKGKIDGISLRVPTPDVSVVELTAEVEKKTTIQEVNDAFKQAARSSLQGILDVSDEPLVSVDYIGSFYSSVVDALSTNVIDGTFLHVSSWYDNEMGYSARCVDLLAHLARK